VGKRLRRLELAGWQDAEGIRSMSLSGLRWMEQPTGSDSRRGRQFRRQPDQGRPGQGQPDLGRPPRVRVDRVRVVALLAGIAVGVVVGGWTGVVVGVVAGVGVDRWVRRLEPRAVRAARLRAESDLPFALDLLAAALLAGAPPSGACVAVGDALGGPLGERLSRVGRALALGTPTTEAWAAVRDLPAGGRLATAADRASRSGAALGGALVRLAADLRAVRLAELESAGQRAGVLVVLPLGLCFLPAFVLGGLVPIVVSMLGNLLP
jgi:Flp pilus assembly protein TadB